MIYQVEIDIDATGLQNIAAANQFITLVRSVSAFVYQTDIVKPGTAARTVAWLSVAPRAKNVIAWNERVDVYATAALPAGGRVIDVNARTQNAQPQQTTPFRNGAFGSPSPTPAVTGYGVTNLTASLMYFGLVAVAKVNGKGRSALPMNVEPVLPGETADFAVPSQTITISLMNVANSGTLLPPDPSGGLTLDLGSLTPPVKVGFNDLTSHFFQQ